MFPVSESVQWFPQFTRVSPVPLVWGLLSRPDQDPPKDVYYTRVTVRTKNSLRPLRLNRYFKEMREMENRSFSVFHGLMGPGRIQGYLWK